MIYTIDSITDFGAFSLCIKQEDGSEWRRAYVPGDDISDLPIDIQDQISKIWTPEAIQAYADLKAQWPVPDNPDPIVPVQADLETRIAKLEAAIDTMQAAQADLISKISVQNLKNT